MSASFKDPLLESIREQDRLREQLEALRGLAEKFNNMGRRRQLMIENLNGAKLTAISYVRCVYIGSLVEGEESVSQQLR